MTRTRAEEYRRLAQQCVTAARLASTEEGRAALTAQAAFWSRLAEEQDRPDADIGAPVQPAATPDQPVAQQQQQVQPQDDDKTE